MKRKQEEEDRKKRAEEEKAMQVGCYLSSLIVTQAGLPPLISGERAVNYVVSDSFH